MNARYRMRKSRLSECAITFPQGCAVRMHTLTLSRCDISVQIEGTVGKRFQYAAGIFAGTGANRSIRGVGPMFTTRMTADLVRERELWGRPVKIDRDSHSVPMILFVNVRQTALQQWLDSLLWR
jgi:hypothetical protein